MTFGRLLRIGTHRGDPHAVVYVVAESDAEKATEIVRNGEAKAGHEIEDLGRVSAELLVALNLKDGEYTRA
jgi:hypothetical protein